MTTIQRRRSFAPDPRRAQALRSIPTEHLAENVDAAFVEFMTSLHECAARASLNPNVTLGWLIAQMIDANYHWAHDLGKHGFINFRTNPHVGASFAETVKKFERNE